MDVIVAAGVRNGGGISTETSRKGSKGLFCSAAFFAMGLLLSAACGTKASAQVVVGGVQSQVPANGVTYPNGGTAGEWYGPVGVATDSSGNIYVADQSNNRIVEYSTASNSIVAYYPTPAFARLDCAGAALVTASSSSRRQAIKSP